MRVGGIEKVRPVGTPTPKTHTSESAGEGQRGEVKGTAAVATPRGGIGQG